MLILIGVGTWVGVGTGTPTTALAASTVDPFAMMANAKDLPTSHYDDYSWSSIELAVGQSLKAASDVLGPPFSAFSSGSFATWPRCDAQFKWTYGRA